MRPSIALQNHRVQINSVVIVHLATNVHVFGSVVHREDTDESDLDLLIDPIPETSLMDIGAIRLEHKRLLINPLPVIPSRVQVIGIIKNPLYQQH